MKLSPNIEICEEDDLHIMKTKWTRQSSLMKCSSFEDILKICKNSERIMDDLQSHLELQKKTSNLSLIICKWKDVSLENELRVFVKNSKIICVCNMFHELVPEVYQNFDWHNLEESTKKLLDQKQILTIQQLINQKGFFFDCALDVVKEDNNIKLIEINPLTRTTDTFKFDWDQINSFC